MDSDRAYPRLRLVHVLLSGVAAVLFVAGGWIVLRVLPETDRANRAAEFQALRAIGIAYHEYRSLHGQSPRRAADLEPLLATNHPQAWNNLQDEKYDVVWRGDLSDPRPWELALACSIPNDGDVLVLYADNHVERIPAEDVAVLIWVSEEP